MKKTREPSFCTRCSADISHRSRAARRCEPCAAKEDLERARASYARKYKSENRPCADCSTDIKHKRASARRCDTCAAKHDREVVRVWRQDNHEYYLSEVKAWQQANKARLKNNRLKKTYGLSLDDLDAMYAAQGGKCACCGIDKPSRGKDGLHVDHCHTTGNVRGLLCSTCNKLEGFLDKHAEQYRAVIEYHARHNARRAS